MNCSFHLYSYLSSWRPLSSSTIRLSNNLRPSASSFVVQNCDSENINNFCDSGQHTAVPPFLPVPEFKHVALAPSIPHIHRYVSTMSQSARSYGAPSERADDLNSTWEINIFNGALKSILSRGVLRVTIIRSTAGSYTRAGFTWGKANLFSSARSSRRNIQAETNNPLETDMPSCSAHLEGSFSI